MPPLICNTCNAEFPDETSQKTHYRSDWHQYNLRRKVAGVPSVTEALYNVRCEALAAEKKELEPVNLLYICVLCNREYRSRKAHTQHLSSKLHIQKASLLENKSPDAITVIRPAPVRPENVEDNQKVSNCDGGDEWLKVDDVGDVMSLDSAGVDGNQSKEAEMAECESNWDPCQCFFCDNIPDGTIEGCIEHMHKHHGFFIPDVEYLKDPKGLLSYLGLKVTKGHVCLYCEDQGKTFQSLEAVRKHMLSKSHCKLRYGEEGQDEELAEFYDYNSSYLPEEDAQLVSMEEFTDHVSLSGNGCEITVNSTTLGCREFKRYYKQRPRPTDMRDGILVNALIGRYRSMGLSTKQSQKNHMQRCPPAHADPMRVKLGVKSNMLIPPRHTSH